MYRTYCVQVLHVNTLVCYCIPCAAFTSAVVGTVFCIMFIFSLLPYSMYTAPGDYTVVTPQHLTFSSAPDQMCITVSISNDGAVEPTESFIVTLSSTDPAVQLMSPTASVTIFDSTSKYLLSCCGLSWGKELMLQTL